MKTTSTRLLHSLSPLSIAAVLLLEVIVKLTAAGSSLDRFRWQGLPGAATVGAPFHGELHAVDVSGALLSDFNATVQVEARMAPRTAQVVITEIETIATERVELMNLGNLPVDISGWRLIFYDYHLWPSPKVQFVFPAGTVCTPGAIFTVSGSGSHPGAWPAFSLGINLSWGAPPSYPHAAARLCDTSLRSVDTVFVNQSYAGFVTQPWAITPDEWSGPPVAANTDAQRTFQRAASLNHHAATDWLVVTNSFGLPNPGLTASLLPVLLHGPLTPGTLTFTGGVWRGELIYPGKEGTAVLVAFDGLGGSGRSDPIVFQFPPALPITLPPIMRESPGGNNATGSIQLASAAEHTVTIRLNSSIPGEIAVPAEVTIAPGQSSVEFALHSSDDAELNGPRQVTITASADGWGEASGVVLILDDEPARLTLTMPPTVTETPGQAFQAGVFTNCLVSLSAAAVRPIPVRIHSNHPERIQAPDVVWIPAGESTARFTIVLPDNLRYDGDLAVRFTAFVDGWDEAGADVLIRDNETLQGWLSFPPAITEGTGVVACGASVSSAQDYDVTFTITNPLPQHLVLPTTVTIPAGVRELHFPAEVLNDGIPQADGAVTINYSANIPLRFASGTVTILDRNLHHIFVEGPKTPVLAGMPVQVKAGARTASGWPVPDCDAVIALSAARLGGSVPVVPGGAGSLREGDWVGDVTLGAGGRSVVLRVDDGQGHVGISEPFDVFAGLELPWRVADLVYDAKGRRLLVATQPGSALLNNSLLEVDPGTGAIQRQMSLYPGARAVALSADSERLYVGLASTTVVMRVSLPSWSKDMEFSAPFRDTWDGIGEIKEVPGDPRSVVVRSGSRTEARLSYHRDGQIMGPVVPFYGGLRGDYMAFFGEPGRFYASQAPGPAGVVHELELGVAGMSVVRSHSGFPGELVSACGLLFSSSGIVFDATRLRALGSYPTQGIFLPLPELGLVCWLNGARLRAWELSTFKELGYQDLPVDPTSPFKIVYCGGNRLAVATTDGRLQLLDLYLIPEPMPADLSLSQSGPLAPVVVGSEFVLQLTVSNAGPATATEPVLVSLLPPETDLVSASVQEGLSVTNGFITCRLGPLAAGTSTNVTLNFRPNQPGPLWSAAWVPRDGIAISNSVVRWVGTATLGARPFGRLQLPLNCLSMAWDQRRNLLWIGSARQEGHRRSVLIGLDLHSGLVGAEIPFEEAPTWLAISSSGRFLHAVYNKTSEAVQYLARVDLDSGVIDRRTRLVNGLNYPYTVVGLAATDVFPDGIVVSRDGPSNDLAVYENGEVAVSLRPGWGVRALIEAPTIPGRIYGLILNEVTQFSIQREGIQELGRAVVLELPYAAGAPQTTHARLAGGKLFSDSGAAADPETLTQLARPPVGGRLVETDPEAGTVVYLLVRPGGWCLTALHVSDYSSAWALDLPGVKGTPERLLRCGPTQFAISTAEDQVFVVDTGVIQPGLSADLAVSQLASVARETTNVPVTFTTWVTNRGEGLAWNARLVQQLPAGAILIAANASKGTLRTNGSELVLELGVLPWGGNAMLQVAATLPTVGTLVSLSSVTQSTPDPDAGNNTAAASAEFGWIPTADISTRSELIRPASDPTEPAVLRVTISNAGPEPATSVQWVLNPISGGAFLGIQPSQGTTNYSAGTFSAWLGTIPAGSQATVDIFVAATNGVVVQYQQFPAAAEFDPDPGNSMAFCVQDIASTDPKPLVEEIPFQAFDIAFDPRRNLLYGSASGPPSPFAGTIAAIDPTTLRPRFLIPVHEGLHRLVLSDDGRYLYGASLATPGAVIRVDLDARQVDLRFGIGDAAPSTTAYFAFDLAVMPGRPGTIAVARATAGETYSDVVIYDEGVPRPDVLPPVGDWVTYKCVGFVQPDRLLAGAGTRFQVSRVTLSGLTSEGAAQPISQGRFQTGNSTVYFRGGEIMDAATGRFLATLPFPGPVALDPQRQQVVCLSGSDASGSFNRQLVVRAYGDTSYQEEWSIPLRLYVGYDDRILKLGDDSFAVALLNGRLFKVRSDQLTSRRADLTVRQVISPSFNVARSNLKWQFIVRNEGPWTATGVALAHTVPPGVSIVSISSTVGTWARAGDEIRFDLGSLTNDSTAVITVNAQPSTSGALTNLVSVRGNEPDPNPSDNLAVSVSSIQPFPAVSAPDVPVLEGATTGSITFRALLSSPTLETVTLRYRTTDGTALAGIDYTPTNGVLTFGPGITNRTFALSILRGNKRAEPDRTFHLELFNPTNATIGRALLDVNILDDDFRTVQVLPVSVLEGNSGTTTASFQVRLSEPSPTPVRVDYATVPGSAQAGSDFLERFGTLLFASGVTNLSLQVPVLGDTRAEADEYFTLTLTSPEGAVLSAHEAAGKILNDDIAPPLPVLGVIASGTDLLIRFQSIEGRIYRLEFSHQLDPPDWTPATGPLPGTGDLTETRVQRAGEQGFYRIVLLP